MSVCVSVCLSLAAFPHYCTDPDVSWGNGRGYPLVVHCLADLQFAYEFCCCDNIEPNAKCQQVLVLALCLVWKSNQGPVFEMPCTTSHNVASISNCWNLVNVHISLRTLQNEAEHVNKDTQNPVMSCIHVHEYMLRREFVWLSFKVDFLISEMKVLKSNTSLNKMI